MRFVFVNHHYSPDIHSPEEWVNRLKFYVGFLEELSKTHEVIRVDQINYEGEFTHKGVKYYCIDAGKKSKDHFPFKLHRFVKTLQPDILVVGSFLFPLQVIQLRMRLGKKVKIIVQNHADKAFTGLKKHIQRIASKSVDAFVFASQAMGEERVDSGSIDSKKKIYEIVGGSSIFYPLAKEVTKARMLINGELVFLWVGRLNKNKDPLLVVKTFLKFVNKQPAAKLYMIYQNDDLLNEIETILNGHENANAIVLVGKVPNEELLYWFNSADFYISASHYEGSGTALGEAMSCGCIPVVTDIFSFRAITNNGDCGLLYQVGDQESLMNALIQSTYLDRKIKGEKCLTYFKNELSFEAIAEKFYIVATSL